MSDMINSCEFASHALHANTRGRCCTFSNSHSQVFRELELYVQQLRSYIRIPLPSCPHLQVLHLVFKINTPIVRPMVPKSAAVDLLSDVTCYRVFFISSNSMPQPPPPPFYTFWVRGQSGLVPLEKKVVVMEGRCSSYILLYQPILGVAHGGIVSPQRLNLSYVNV